MIRVEIVEEAKNRGVFRYRVPGMAIEGRSRKPLIDACRRLKRSLGPLNSVQAFSVREVRIRTSVAPSSGLNKSPRLRYMGHKNIQPRVRYSWPPPNTLPFRLTKCTPAQAWQVIPS